MYDNKSYIKNKINSERNFGIVFGSVFLIISLYPLLNNNNIRIWALLISLFLFVISLLFPKILQVPNKLWFKFGNLLGYIVAPIIMGIIFLIIITPIGVIINIFNKDFFNKKINKSVKSYWVLSDKKKINMKDQF